MYATIAQAATMMTASTGAIDDGSMLERVIAAQQASAVVVAEQVADPAEPAEQEEQLPPQESEAGDEALPPEEQAQDPAPPVDGNVIIVSGRPGAPPGDPMVRLNEATFEISQKVDAAFVEPIAEVYEEDIPKPLRNGLRNFLRNLMEPVNALNFLLQLKPGKAFETLGRFAINSTLGVAGLFDVAEDEPFNLPYRRNGLSNTLGYYGVGPGPFLVLPLVGATTLRDLIGNTVDQAIVPLAVGAPLNTPYYAVPAYSVNSLQYRMEFDERIDSINDSVDPYYALRESYLCLREADIAALRNLPPPRDCSIDALIAASEAAEQISNGTGEEAPLAGDEAAVDTGPEAVGDPATESVPEIEAAPAAEVAPEPETAPEGATEPVAEIELDEAA